MKPVKFKILVRYCGKNRHVADITINILGGDWYYSPSGGGTTVSGGDLAPAGTQIHHLSFHRDGRSHARSQIKNADDKNGGKYPAVKFLPTQDIGYQVFLQEEITNIEELPVVEDAPKKRDKQDDVPSCTLELPNDRGAGVIIQLSIISGRMIAKKQATSKTVGQDGLIDVDNRALGHESGNGDKLLQISLKAGTPSPPNTNKRSIRIPPSSGIKRPSI